MSTNLYSVTKEHLEATTPVGVDVGQEIPYFMAGESIAQYSHYGSQKGEY